MTAPVSDDARAYVARIVEALGDRIKVFGDILLQAPFFFGDEVDVRREGLRQARARAGRRRSPRRLPRLARPARDGVRRGARWSEDTQELMAEQGLGLGDIVHAVRVAVTGVPVGPGLFDCSSCSARRPACAASTGRWRRPARANR